jgi:hypothetical protein
MPCRNNNNWRLPRKGVAQTWRVILAVSVLGAAGGGWWAGLPFVCRPSATGGVPRETVLAEASGLPWHFADLMSCPRESLAGLGVALVSLLCAQGLPGAEGFDVQLLLKTIDSWARRVERDARRHLYRFHANPRDYDNSEGYFRMLLMAVVAAEDFGVRYNPARISPVSQGAGNDGFFADAQDVFLHGLLGPRRLGTCSSMPILYVALGRRMGYPLKLVTTKGHLFLRWESTTERFNLEATGRA